MIKWKFKDKSEQITRTSLKAKAIIGVVLCADTDKYFTADDCSKKDLQYYNMVIVLWNRGSMRKQ